MKIIDLEAFKELVHRCSSVTGKANVADVEMFRDHKDIFTEIASFFGSDRKIALANLDQLLSELSIKSVAEGEPLEFAFETIRVLIDSLRQSNESQPGFDDPWSHAVKLIMENQHIFIADIAPERMCPARYLALGHHVKALRDMGYAVEFVNGRPDVSSEEMTRINAEIERICKELGGPTLIYNILRFISDTYDSTQQRYHLTRNLSTNPARNVPSPPWGLMLQFAVKQGPASVEPADPSRSINDLIRLLTATVGLGGFEPSSIFDMLLHSDDTIIDFLQRAVIYDALYSLNQIRPSDAAQISSALFDDWIAANQASEIRNALDIWHHIDSLSTPQTPFAFETNALSRCSGQSKDQIIASCEHILAHGLDGPNKLLEFPVKPDSIDFGKRPLITTASAGFCMIEKSVCSPNFLEAIFLAVLASKRRFDFGKALEDLLRTALANSGVNSKTGKYTIKKLAWDSAKEAECDAVVETNEEILFLEVKAKSLTRAAQAGDTHALIDDLAGTLIDAHTQALKHELRLRTYGTLEFENGDTLVLAGRKIERIVVAVSDFGCLHSRSVFEKFLSLCCRGDVASHSQPDRFTKVNEKLTDMRLVLSMLNKIGGLNQKKPFWNSWFLSIPQILLILDSVKCEKDFVNELVRLRAIVQGTFDFYREYQLARSWQGG